MAFTATLQTPVEMAAALVTAGALQDQANTFVASMGWAPVNSYGWAWGVLVKVTAQNSASGGAVFSYDGGGSPS
jgi:hypothetical protein